MAELTESDRRVLVLAATIAARRKIAPMIGLFLPHVTALRSHLPSYVNDAIDNVLASLDRWEKDETAALLPRGKA